MITPIKFVSFTANPVKNARDAYSEKVGKNDATAQAQTGLILSPKDNSMKTSNQISLQGNNAGKKLDTIA